MSLKASEFMSGFVSASVPDLARSDRQRWIVRGKPEQGWRDSTDAPQGAQGEVPWQAEGSTLGAPCGRNLTIPARDGVIRAATGQPAGSGIPEMDPVRKYVLLVLRQAWHDGASEVVFGESAGPKEQAGVPVKYLVAGRWYDMTPFPEHLWAQVVMQLLRMAGAELVPAAGDILSEWEGTMFWWRLTAPSLEGPLRLKRAQAWNAGGPAASSDDPTSPHGGT